MFLRSSIACKYADLTLILRTLHLRFAANDGSSLQNNSGLISAIYVSTDCNVWSKDTRASGSTSLQHMHKCIVLFYVAPFPFVGGDHALKRMIL